MLALPDTRTTWIGYALLLGLLAAVAYGGLAAQALDTDDFEYLRDAAAAQQDYSLLFSTDRELPGRPVAEVVFLLGHSLWGDNPAPYHLLVVAFHLITSLLLAWTFRRLGADLDLSMAGGLLFLVNVAHFRAVQWIACLVYPLALGLGLVAILLFAHYLATDRRAALFGAALVQVLAVLAHAGSICAAAFCFYLAWRRHGRPLAAAPLLGVAALVPVLLHLLYPQAPQSRETLSVVDPIAVLGQLLGYAGRSLSAAHWLVAGQVQTVEMVAGLAALIGAVWLVTHRKGPEADWALFALIALAPFVARVTLEPSRFLYMSSAGSALVLAWLLRAGLGQLQRLAGPALAKTAMGAALAGLVATSLFSLHKAETLAFYLSGRAYDARSQQDQARDLYKQAVNRDPRLIPYDGYARMATAAFRYGDPCQSELERGVAIYPNNSTLRFFANLGGFLQTDDAYQRAGTMVDAAVEQLPVTSELRRQGAVALHHIGLYYGEKGDNRRAIDVFEYALALRPDYAMALGGLAEVYKRSGENPQAIDYYRRFLRVRPQMAAGHFNLANLLIQEKNLPEAIEALRQGVALEGHHPGPWYKLAQLYRATFQAPEAEGAIRNALDRSQTARDYWIEYGNIAFLYNSLKQTPKALAIYKKVTRAIPAYPSAHFNLGLLQYRQGLYADAVASFRQVVQLSPDDEEAQRALVLATKRMENSVSILVEDVDEG